MKKQSLGRGDEREASEDRNGDEEVETSEFEPNVELMEMFERQFRESHPPVST